MFKITLPADRAVVDMAAVAREFGVSIQQLHDDMRTGTISRWLEVAEGDADDKPHKIFASEKLGIRVEVDEGGNVYSTSEYPAVRSDSLPDRIENSHSDGNANRLETALDRNSKDTPATTRKSRLDALLDEALDESFPASDPVAISFEPPPRATVRDAG